MTFAPIEHDHVACITAPAGLGPSHNVSTPPGCHRYGFRKFKSGSSQKLSETTAKACVNVDQRHLGIWIWGPGALRAHVSRARKWHGVGMCECKLRAYVRRQNEHGWHGDVGIC